MRRSTAALSRRFIVRHPCIPRNAVYRHSLPSRSIRLSSSSTTYERKTDRVSSTYGAPKGSGDRHSLLRQLRDQLRAISRKQKFTDRDVTDAEELVRKIEAAAVQHHSTSLSTTPYNQLLRAYARSDDRQAITKTKDILQRMNHMDDLPTPDIYTYDAALYVCTTSLHPEAPQIAEEIFHELLSLADSGSDVAPTLTSYHNVILAHANQAQSIYGAAASAEDWLMQLSDRSCQPGQQHLRPTTQAFNHVLQAWAISPEHNGADRALQVLELMMSLDDEGTLPDAVSFATVIHAMARRDRPEEAEQILKRALDYFTIRQQDQQENVILTDCLNRTMGAWSRSSCMGASQRARDLLDDAYTLTNTTSALGRVQLAPNAATHYYYIMTLLKEGLAGVEQADAHLHDMIHGYKEAVGRRSSTGCHFAIAPTIGTVHTVMKGWIASEREDGVERAMNLLKSIVELADTTRLPRESLPVTGTFNLCIDGWCKSSLTHAAEMAAVILEWGEKRRCVDASTFQMTIHYLCRTRSAATTWKAVELLQRYEEHAEQGTVAWNAAQAIGLYTAVISELGRLNTEKAANTALSLFRSIPSTGPRAAWPTSKTYTSLMVCFARLRSPDAAEIVCELFQEMKALDLDASSKVRLDLVAYRTALRSLARANNQDCMEDVISFLVKQIGNGRKDLMAHDFLSECKRAVTQARLPEARRQKLERELDSIKL